MSDKKYTVRPIGCSSWSECDTIEQARRDAVECRDRMTGVEIVIVDNRTDEVVE